MAILRLTAAHGPVVADVYDLDESDSADAPEHHRGIVVPAAEQGQKRLDLRAGTYLVEALLPSGESLSTEITLTDDGEDRTLSLFEETADEPLEKWTPRTPKFMGEWLQSQPWHKVDLVAERPLAGDPGALPPGYFFDLDVPAGPSSLKRLDSVLEVGDPDTLEVVTLSHRPRRTRGAALYRLSARDVSESFDGDHRWTAENVRRFLFLRGVGVTPQYTVLPLPWHRPDHHGEADLEVLVDTAVQPQTSISPGAPPRHRLQAAIRDPMVGTVIAYLAAGRDHAASAVIGPAMHMLFDKMSNPLASAAGGHVLMAAAGQARGDHWHRWIRNLRNWFEWLPDGAILHGWLELNTRETDGQLPAARGAFLEGFRRGLPYYTRGVDLLLDGLSLFAAHARQRGETDEDVERALAVVQRLSRRIDPQQPFTTVLLH